MPQNRYSTPTSDGWKHTQITLGLSVVAAVAALLCSPVVPQQQAGSLLLGATLGCLSGIVLSPDLDQTSLTVSEWYILKIPVLGYVIGPLFVAFWLPYSRMFKHRSIWTHGPIISTLVRLVYIGVMVFILTSFIPYIQLGSTYYSTSTDNLVRLLFRQDMIPGISAWICGLMLSDIGHWLRDIGVLQ